MHRDPPPGLFDPRRPVAHVISIGLAAGFTFAIVTHFGWNLWRQGNGTPAPSRGMDDLVVGLQGNKATPTPPPAVRY